MNSLSVNLENSCYFNHTNIENKLLGFCFAYLFIKEVVFFIQHGESMHNLNGRIGGNSDLSDQGEKVSSPLLSFHLMQHYYFTHGQFRPRSILFF